MRGMLLHDNVDGANVDTSSFVESFWLWIWPLEAWVG